MAQPVLTYAIQRCTEDGFGEFSERSSVIIIV